MNRMIACLLLVITCCNSCSVASLGKEVHVTKGTVPTLPAVNITDPKRFLNDLMLSPYWKVEKDRDGAYVANARSIYEEWFAKENGSFLFEIVGTPDWKPMKDQHIHNSYLSGEKDFSTLRVSVSFHAPDVKTVTLGTSGKEIRLSVFEYYEDKISPNSSSTLAIKLSDEHEIYLIVHEQGADPDRKTTFEKLPLAMKHLSELATPETYRVEERYSTFFDTFFSPPLKDKEVGMFPGTQDRDTFYGYLRTKKDTNYAGVNIKISHPVYCPDEGTRKSSRLRKAEYLGKPYHDGDVVFFLIEDNAVYLSGEYDQRFGTFSGKESFEGDLELMGHKGNVLLKTKGNFKGWQR